MAKKLAAVLLSMLLVLSLAACKRNIQDTSVTDTNTQAVSENETESSAAASEKTIQAETEQARGADETTVQQAETTTSADDSSAANSTTTAKQADNTNRNTSAATKQSTTARTTAATKSTTARQTSATTTKPTTAKPNYNVTSSNSEVRAVYSLVNQERSNNGLGKLAYRNDLQSAANTRAKEIVSSFSHTRPNGPACFTAIKETGVSYSAAGENIGKTNGANSDMMSWWMNSSDHKSNILSEKYTGIAVGCYEQDGYKYYVQIFVS